MRLLQINTHCNISSTGRLAEDLGIVAQKNGWESYIAYGRDGKPSNSHTYRFNNNVDVYFHYFYSRLFDRHSFGSYFATKRLVNYIKIIKPDIIQIHNLHGYYINIPILFNFLKESRIPVVWSLHDCWTMTGHCSHFTLAKCYKWRTLCENCPIISDYPKAFIDQSRRNYLDKKKYFTNLPNLNIISASRWLGDIVEQSFFKEFPLHIIPNGIDTTIFHPYENRLEVRSRYGIKDDDFVIIATGTSWDDAKGLPDFYRLQKRIPNDWKIVLVGLSESQLKQLPHGIIGLKRTSNVREMAELYSMSDVVVSLSYMEAFGLTPIEGFACGTPALVYDCTSTPELVTDETGYIAEPGNIEDVFNKLMLIKKKGKKTYSNDCVSLAMKKYKKEVCFKQYLNLYENILSH